MSRKQLSSIRIILIGQLIVNLPILIIIFICTVILIQLGIVWNISLIIAAGIGWYAWGKLLKKWKSWALNQNVDRERLFRLGKLGLLNFHKDKIFDTDKESVED